ncbi:hypothetical protein JXI42_01730 [bacterium]|nr:hypothetical protein [bacterium]
MVSSSWGVPRLVEYQGKVTDNLGIGLNGTFPVLVRIYDDADNPNGDFYVLMDHDTTESKGIYAFNYGAGYGLFGKSIKKTNEPLDTNKKLEYISD